MGVSSGRRFNDINITPLVDVMLVLLIVFMVTAPLLPSGLKVELPEVEGNQTSLRDTKLVVTVTANDQIIFGDLDVTADIESVLLADERVKSEREIYVRADKSAHYGIVARVVAAARKAGVEGINLLVEPDPEPAPGTREGAPAGASGR